MKTFYKKFIIASLLSFLGTGLSFGQASPINETFSNLGPYGGYQNETWTGDDGGTWTATDARTDRTINGDAIMVRDGELTSPSVSGGIGDLTVTTQRQFSGGSGNMDLRVNGTSVGSIPYDGTVQTTTISGINISGNVIVVIDATNSSSDRVVIDDLQWTAYTSGPPTSYCTVNGDTSFGTAITLVELGSISNSTGAGSGYDDFTSQSTSVTQGGSANLTVNLNTAGNYTVHAIGWIDWNQDFIFDTSTEQYDLGDATNVTNGATSLSPLSISIPAGASLGNTRMRIVSRYDIDPSGPCAGSDDGEIEDYTINVTAGSSPTITLSESTLSALDYVDGSGPSAEQTFTAEGSNLTGDIVLTAPADFEISTTSGSGFGSTLNLTPSSGTVTTTDIYVRLAAGLAVNTYSATLMATSTGATQQNISLSGEVTAASCAGSSTTFPFNGVSGSTNLEHSSSNPPLSTGDESCGTNYLIYYDTAPSTDGSTNFLRSNATDDLIESEDWGGEGKFETFAIDVSGETSVDIETFGSTTGSGFNAGSEEFQWWYKLDGGTETNLGSAITGTGSLAVGPTTVDVTGVSEIIVGFTFDMNGGSDGFEDVNVTVTATPTAPSITLSETTLSALDYVDGSGPSAEQTFTAEGSNLTGDIVLTAPADFEISTTSGSGFGSTLNLTPSSGTVTTTDIYVRLAAGLAVNTYSGTLTATSTGATQQDVSLSGEVTSAGTACGVEIDFETQGVGYSTSIAEFTDNDEDYFTQTSQSDISASFTGADGSFFAAQDIDDQSATLPVELTINNIDISTLTNLEFSIDLAEDGSSGSDHWDDDDYVRIYYTIDSGTEQNLLWIQNDGTTFNTAPLIDTDFDGIGDGTEITDTFATFTESIGSTGSSMDIRIEFNLDSGDEDIALDNISICGTQSSTTYTYTDNTTGWNTNPVTGTPPSTIADNIEVLAGTAVLDGVIEGKNLSVSSGATLELGSSAVLSLDGDITNDGTILFKSDATGSAQLDEFTGTIATGGTITVERFIPASNRAFRFLATPITSSGSINTNWQEGATTTNYNPNSGFGTHITGVIGTVGDVNTNGLDETASGSPSMFTFDNSNANGGAQDDDWQAVSNTASNNLNANTPYLLFVRGDRSISLSTNNTSATVTTLRAAGNSEDLLTGTQSPNTLNGTSLQYSKVANPYQATIDICDVSRTNLNDFIWVRDPSSGTFGAYETVNISGTGMGLCQSSEVSNANRYIPPGSSFFVQNGLSTPPTLEFNEGDKAVNQTAISVFSSTNVFYIQSELFETSELQNGESKRDAFVLEFGNQFSTPGDSTEDADKLINTEENISIDNNGLKYIDRQDMPNIGHSVQLNTFGYSGTAYSLSFDIENKPESLGVFIQDDYLGTQIELTDNFVFNFTVDAGIPESIAEDRFSLVFDNTTLSVDNNTFGRDFSLYPNPAENGRFNIKTPNLNGDVQIEISNILGQQVSIQNLTVEAQEVKVNAENLSNGIYVVKLTQNGQSYSTKLMID